VPKYEALANTGTITDGPLTGATISGTDFFLLRPDGIGQVNVRERITRGDRVVAALRFIGYVVPPIPMPELPTLLSPDFEWPDIDLPMHGAAFFDATSEELPAATATVYGATTGAVNLAARTLRLERPLGPELADGPVSRQGRSREPVNVRSCRIENGW